MISFPPSFPDLSLDKRTIPTIQAGRERSQRIPRIQLKVFLIRDDTASSGPTIAKTKNRAVTMSRNTPTKIGDKMRAIHNFFMKVAKK
jgi:hypothetical protein